MFCEYLGVALYSVTGWDKSCGSVDHRVKGEPHFLTCRPYVTIYGHLLLQVLQNLKTLQKAFVYVCGMIVHRNSLVGSTFILF